MTGNPWSRLKAMMPHRNADIVGINRRNLNLVYPHNPREHYPLADDKLLTKESLLAAGVNTPRVLTVCDGLYAVDSVVERLLEDSNFVIKPARGSGGDGLLVVGECESPGRWRRAGGGLLTADAVRTHLGNIVFGTWSKDRPDRAIVEERIRPHPVHAAMWADGLSDIRAITFEGKVLMTMLRVPTARSGGRGNLHQGGLGVAIDIESGRTTRAFCKGRPVEHHPDTGAPLIGVLQPSWPDVLAAACAAAAVPLGYLGTDIVVDVSGRALVLEINARPGLEIQNVVGRGLGTVLGAAEAIA